MSAKANPAAIGLFVCVALAISAAAIITLGMGKFLKERTTYVLYFDGALSGLDVGAPVQIKGVRVGSVSAIKMYYDHHNKDITVPVYIEIERQAFSEKNTHMAGEAGSGMKAHIERGLRAQLNMQSIVTGKLKVDLVYAPNNEAAYKHEGEDSDIMEIPTMPNTFETVFERLGELPLEEIVKNINRSTESLAKLAESGDLEKMLANLSEMTGELNATVKEGEFKAILADIQKLTTTMAKVSDDGELEKLIRETRKAVETISTSLGEADIGKTMTSIDDTLKEGKELMKTSQTLVKNVDRNSGLLRKDLARALEDLADAARASRNLLEYLERHPEALLRGKGDE